MTKDTHTLGPWQIIKVYDGWIIEGRDTGHGLTICVSNEGREGLSNRRPENEANARLIAAAPDMLTALREVEDFLDDRSDVDDGIPNDAMRHLVEVRAAIAKAEGNSTDTDNP